MSPQNYDIQPRRPGGRLLHSASQDRWPQARGKAGVFADEITPGSRLPQRKWRTPIAILEPRFGTQLSGASCLAPKGQR